MKNLIRVTLVVLSFALVFTTWGSAQSAADLFKSKCAVCHGPDGKGETAMGKNLKLKDLASEEAQKQTDADMKGLINKGKGKMQPYEGKLTPEQIDSLVKHVRSLKK